MIAEVLSLGLAMIDESNGLDGNGTNQFGK